MFFILLSLLTLPMMSICSNPLSPRHNKHQHYTIVLIQGPQDYHLIQNNTKITSPKSDLIYHFYDGMNKGSYKPTIRIYSKETGVHQNIETFDHATLARDWLIEQLEKTHHQKNSQSACCHQ